MSAEKYTTIALVVAAGRGTRLRQDTGSPPKAYIPICGKPLLAHTLEALEHPSIDAIACVIHPDDEALYQAVRQEYGSSLILPPLHGGARREDSVRNGLDGIAHHTPENVLIHDAARPFVPGKLIDNLLAALENADAALPIIPISDTVRELESGEIKATLNRQHIYRAQTPQAFRFQTILDLHHRPHNDVTDDIALCETAGIAIAPVPGDQRNIKITAPDDVMLAEQMLQGRYTTRTGTGFDVHRFSEDISEGNLIRLGGVDIPHPHALIGHSDADVALHALVDAILGALGLGDIGEHFPPSDPQWKGADSHLFVRHAINLMEEQNATLMNADITVICEAPKLKHYKAAIKSTIASLCKVNESCINIKATTTEELGFTGRKEGIAAQAIATIRVFT